jgi:hypothetical protein
MALSLLALPAVAGAQTPSGPTITIDNPSPIVEEDSGVGGITFTVTVAGDHPSGVSVNYRTVPNDATQGPLGTSCPSPGVDYLENQGTLTYLSGETTKTILVATCGDTLHEADETFKVQLFGESGATVLQRESTGTIIDDDPAPTISVGNATVTEPGPGQTVTASFNVTLNAKSGLPVSYNFATANSTATGGTCAGGADYATTNGTGTIAAGQTTSAQPITVTVCGDALDENSETFRVNLSNVVGASQPTSGTGTILDDDAPPALSVDPASVTEGDTGTRNMTFTIRLSTASGRDVTVNYATGDATATGGTTCATNVDYLTTSSSTTIAHGATSKTVTVPVCGDLPDEFDETFNLFASASGATGSPNAAGTILDDDPLPILVPQSPTARSEGDSGTTSFPLLYLLIDPRDNSLISTGKGVTFDLTSSDGSPSDQTRNATGGSACGTAGIDYVAQSALHRTIAVNGKLTTLQLPVCGDTTVEKSELLTVAVTNVQNATLDTTRTSTPVTIVNDDGPGLSIADATGTEGGPVTFTITLTGATSNPVTVKWTTSDGTAKAQNKFFAGCIDPIHNVGTGNDYGRGGGTITFPASTAATQTQTVSVSACTDNISLEGDETFHVKLSQPDFAKVTDGDGLGTIHDATVCMVEAGCSGVPTLDPVHTNAVPGRPANVALTWKVPAGHVWRNLEAIDVVLRDHKRGDVLRLRWFETSNTFCVLVANGTCGASGLPGDPTALGGPLARLRLAGTTVKGSGPTGRTVTLGLSFLFGASGGNRQLDVLAAGADDFGNTDAFVRVGRIHVKTH